MPIPTAPSFDAREMAVLVRLATRQDKQIAREHGLSPDGVRYHVRKIFRKLRVHQRQDAVRRLQAPNSRNRPLVLSTYYRREPLPSTHPRW